MKGMLAARRAADAFIHTSNGCRYGRCTIKRMKRLLKRVGDLGGHLRDDAEERSVEPLGQGDGQVDAANLHGAAADGPTAVGSAMRPSDRKAQRDQRRCVRGRFRG